ncbi:MAG: hypothetical protein IK093_14585 [Ruminiclostridium sp.]|nr:hypothetical protein [Ruminiclostridium sp.]
MDFITAGSVVCYGCHAVTVSLGRDFPVVRGVTAVTRLSRGSVTAKNRSESGIEGWCHVCHAIARMPFRSM